MDEDTDVHLSWNQHQTTLLSVFSSLLNNENLVDCTISAEGQHFKAHRVILSACSPYFELLFTKHSEMHPVVILPDVKFQILKALMEFMYSGEVKVPQDKLRTVLELADTLQIKGLSSVGDDDIDDDLRPKRRNESSVLCDQDTFKKHMSEHRSTSQVKQAGVSSLLPSEKEQSEDIHPCPMNTQNCLKSNSNAASPKRTVEDPVMYQDTSDTYALNMLQGSSVTKTPMKSNPHLSGTLLNSNSNILDSSQLSGSYTVKVGEHRMSSENVSSTHLHSEEVRTSASLGVSGEVPTANFLPQLKQEDSDDFSSNSIEEIILDDDTDENDDHTCGSVDDNSSTVAGRVIPEDSMSGHNFCNVEQNRDTYLVEPTSLLPNQFKCNACPRSYKARACLSRHLKYECGKEPQFRCPHCPWRCFHKHNLKQHILSKHSCLRFKQESSASPFYNQHT